MTNSISNKSTVFFIEFVLICVGFLPFYLLYWNAQSADAAIYFTFFKNFFTLPFSFQTQQVNFGATSPLHVIFHTPFWYLFDEPWWSGSKLLNLSLISLGLIFLNRISIGTLQTLSLMMILTALSPIVFITAAQGYETPLAFCFICILCWLIFLQSPIPLISLTGTAYLIRPEFLLLTVPLSLTIIYKSKNTRILFGIFLLSLLPIFLYHSYMFWHIQTLIPSSIVAKATEDTSRWDRYRQSWQALNNINLVIYMIFAATLIFLRRTCKISLNRNLLILLIPLPLLHFLFPPGDQITRYLLPITPILTILIVQITAPWHKLLTPMFIGFLFLGIYGVHYLSLQEKPIYEANAYNSVLLPDLAEEMNVFTDISDTVLIDQPQAQYHLNATTYDLSGVISSPLWQTLSKQNTLLDFIKQNKIGYIVTSQNFDQAGGQYSILKQFHFHNESSQVGDFFKIDDLYFEKIAQNPNELNLPLNADWQAVYKISYAE